MSDTNQKINLVIVGGGASGLMAAGSAIRKNPNLKIVLLEKNNTLGKKLSITGGGRCNVTNAIFDDKELLSKYGPAEKFLYSAFSQFSVDDTFKLFGELGVDLVIQQYNRVFPTSEKASDITDAMVKYATHPNIKILKNITIKKVHIYNSKIDYVEDIKGEKYIADNFILATGGLSRPETGSTGEGFKWLTDMGHTVKTPTPTLVPWIVKDAWIHRLSGSTLDEAKIIVNVNNVKHFSCTGRILFTHRGLSGPLVMNHSAKLQDALQNGDVSAFIDLYPKLNHAEIDQLILKVFEENKNKKIKNVLAEIFKIHSPELFIQKYVKIDLDTPINLVSKENRKELVQLIKKIPIHIGGLEGYDKSIVADGGITLTEVDTKTMRSRRILNLFITGDLLDIRRPSGGFSLQLCWTTGHVAGISAAV